MATPTHQRYTLMRPARDAFNAGNFFTGFVYMLVACLSPLAGRTESRNLSSDAYVMF